MSSTPERTCLVCREKKEKSDLFRIAEVEGAYKFDKNQDIQARGSYICKTHECIKRISKNKKINLSNEDLYNMATTVKKSQKKLFKFIRNYETF